MTRGLPFWGYDSWGKLRGLNGAGPGTRSPGDGMWRSVSRHGGVLAARCGRWLGFSGYATCRKGQTIRAKRCALTGKGLPVGLGPPWLKVNRTGLLAGYGGSGYTSSVRISQSWAAGLPSSPLGRPSGERSSIHRVRRLSGEQGSTPDSHPRAQGGPPDFYGMETLENPDNETSIISPGAPWQYFLRPPRQSVQFFVTKT